MLISWREFLKGKRKRKDVAEFSTRFLDNILSLHEALTTKTYKHGGYKAFKINDPKPRQIHKANVQDRLVHHAIYRALNPYFNSKFIHDSYSCRINKGTHKAVYRFRQFSLQVSKNNTKTCWVLKGDIRKFFANIDHKILRAILARHVATFDILWLLEEITESFHTGNLKTGVGLPLGNLTSQLFINIYMNEFDQFMKRELKAKYYIRYADDFVILHQSRKYLEDILPKISEFFETNLKLVLHPNKVFIKTLASGVDFLGWVHFPHHRILRTSTKIRILRRLEKEFAPEMLASYLGLLSHGDTHKLAGQLKPAKWLAGLNLR